MGNYLRLAGHVLVGKGTAHDQNGTTVAPLRPGRAKCECGWLSRSLPSTGQRREAHRLHKDEVAALAQEGVTS